MGLSACRTAGHAAEVTVARHFSGLFKARGAAADSFGPPLDSQTS
jgi:hypothetical protein